MNPIKLLLMVWSRIWGCLSACFGFPFGLRDKLYVIFIEKVARNVGNPETGIWGTYVSYLFKKTNQSIERNAVEHLQVKPSHIVLEVGFGPGLGIQYGLQKMKGGSGIVHGVDISQTMVNEASKRFKIEIQAKTVQLCKGDVADLPYKDKTFDRVYHTNCYYFWPDMDKATKELHRVMKRNSILLTALVTAKVKKAVEMGTLKYADADPQRYIQALRNNKFDEVYTEDFIDEQDGPYVVIFALKK